MKTKQEIKDWLDKQMADDRLTYPCATVFENAPLALEQLVLETRIHTLQWALDVPLCRFPLRKKKARP